MRLGNVATLLLSANVDSQQVDCTVYDLQLAENWERKVAIVNSVICKLKMSTEGAVRTKCQILFHLMRRVSVGDQRLLKVCYGNKATEMVSNIETCCDPFDMYDACTHLFEHFEDHAYLSDVVRNIAAKEAIFNIYERYGYNILAVMIAAHEQNALDQFLMPFSYWTFNAGSVDLDQIELFIRHLSTF